MNLGLRIRRQREQLGLSQMDLSKLAEIPQSRISELESGARTQMSLQNLRSMARALGSSFTLVAVSSRLYISIFVAPLRC